VVVLVVPTAVQAVVLVVIETLLQEKQQVAVALLRAQSI